MDLGGQRIALYGRMLSRSRAQLAEFVAQHSGVVERDLTRRTHMLVIGRGALSLIPSGHLSRQLARATAQKTSVIGEDRLWAMLAGSEPPPSTFPLDRVTPAAPDALVSLLNAFDLIQVSADQCRFGDVEILRTAMSLLDDGHEMHSVVRILLCAQGAPSGRFQIVTDDGGEPRLDWGDAVTSLDGQGLLPLPGQPTLDDLFDAALLAEAEGRLEDAAQDYALCARMDRRDPIAPFNLANVLVKLGDAKDALTRFGQAIARDFRFAEAYYNRARLLEERGAPSRAMADLRAAIEADPTYSQALFNLAQMELQNGAPQAAAKLLEAFLKLDIDREWRSLATKALAVAAERSSRSSAKRTPS